MVNLSFSFQSHVSKHLVDFIAVDSIVVSAMARLVDNLKPRLKFALWKLGKYWQYEPSRVPKADYLEGMT